MRFEVTNFPKKEIKVWCADCGAEIARIEWDSYADYKRKRAKAERDCAVCPSCKKVVLPIWEKKKGGDIFAVCRNGDFLVWKCPRGYKWRWRRTGRVYADEMGFAYRKDDAKRVCERHKEWQI